MPNRPRLPSDVGVPIHLVETGSRFDAAHEPEEGVGLCLSGGGYRAMLFHLGTLWRLNEFGYLPRLSRVSSVSGGSITAGVLGLHWKNLTFVDGMAQNFVDEVVAPTRGLAGKTIDRESILGGVLLPGSVADRIVDAYRQHLFGSATLQDLPPDPPRFVINATNVQSGVLWRFSRKYMADYRVGKVMSPTVDLAVAVAASSAFPPVLSPLELDVDPSTYAPPSGHPSEDLHREPFTTTVVLTDGGVYDNLGLETVWKRYRTVLASDGGGKMQAEEEPKGDWAQHALRINEIIDNQVRSLRKRQLIGSYVSGRRNGAYWGIRADIKDYGLTDTLACPIEQTTALAHLKTRLKRLDPVVQERLINWGYAVCDAAMRRWVDPGLAAPSGFPYPESGVGD